MYHSGSVLDSRSRTPKPPSKTLHQPLGNNGIHAYQESCELYTKPPSLMRETETTIAVIPIYYNNQRDEGSEVDQCLVPLQELDLYRNDSDDLIFEVVKLTHSEPFYQEPRPLKRPPKEIKPDVNRFLKAPVDARSLFDRVQSLPKLTNLSSMFLNR
ncbi:MAG: hypothetical protein ABEK50_01800 [bacterium]